jgi:hypothetical protein
MYYSNEEKIINKVILKNIHVNIKEVTRQTESLHTLSQPKSSNWNVYESSHSMKRV